MGLKKKLRTGFTTGTAAAAAVKGALILLIQNNMPDSVSVTLPTGNKLDIKIHSLCKNKNIAECIIKKNAGDDPDITNKALIGARVYIDEKMHGDYNDNVISITGGHGVGRITKPGLELPVGEAAINPVPRDMIKVSANDILALYPSKKPLKINIEIFVPKGEELAKKTMNKRLGIIGGISILGTTGIVKPLSHEAYRATILASLSVARAAGCETIILATGRRSEKFAQGVWPQYIEDAFIQFGDYFKFSIENAKKKGFKGIFLSVFFGKAVKIAQGFSYTHAARTRINMNQLANWAFEASHDHDLSQMIKGSNTAREALKYIQEKGIKTISLVGQKMLCNISKITGEDVIVRNIIFDFDGSILFDSSLLNKGD